MGVLYKKKEIDDKTPKLRTEDEKKNLKSLSNQMRKFPKNLIDGIQKKFPFLQRRPKTAEQRKEQVKECKRRKRAAESEIETERRLNKQRKYEHKRFSESTEFRAKKVKEVRERRRQPSKDWKQELIDKASLTHICTSECRYRPKASMVVVRENMFTSKQMTLLRINNETLSIDGKYYVCKSCKNTIQKNRIPPCNEKSYNFMIDKLPEKFLTEEMSLSKLESHLLIMFH